MSDFQAFHEASVSKNKPTAILAKTFKGKNFPEIEDLENWHGKPLGEKSAKVIEVSQVNQYVFVNNPLFLGTFNLSQGWIQNTLWGGGGRAFPGTLLFSPLSNRYFLPT